MASNGDDEKAYQDYLDDQAYRKYLAQQSGAGQGDSSLWESAKGLASEAMQPVKEFSSAMLNTASGNNLAHINAGIQSMLPNPTADADAELESKGIRVPQQGYVQFRDQNLKDLAGMRENSPAISAAGSIAGMALPASIPVAAPVSMAGKVALGAGLGGAFGFAQNPGDTEGIIDPRWGDRAKNAAIGTALGGALSGAGGAIGARMASAGEGLEGTAARTAVSALRPGLRGVKSLADIESAGRTALDEGIIGNIPRSSETLSARTSDALKRAGTDYGNIIDAMDSAAEPLGDGARVRAADMVEGARPELLNPQTRITGVKRDNQFFNDALDEFEKGGNPTLSLKENEALKRGLGDRANWGKNSSDLTNEEKFARTMYDQTKNASEATAASIEGDAGLPSGTFKSAKTRFGNLADIAGITEDRAARDFANRSLSPSDYFAGHLGLSGASSAGAHGAQIPGAAVASAAANHFLRKYGGQIAAKQLDNVGKLLISGSPKMAELASSHPAAFTTLVRKMSDQIHPSGEFTPAPAPGSSPDPEYLRLMKQNPGLLDQIQHPELKQAIQKHMEYEGGRGPAQESAEPIEDSQSRYIDGG